jgi:putative transcriptional regulator
MKVDLSLLGKLIFFSPSERGPSYFTNSLIFICHHNKDGAIGLIINRQLDLDVEALLEGVGLDTANNLIQKKINIGGPVDTGSVFILHKDNCSWDSTMEVSKQIGLTTSMDVLEQMTKGKGPEEYILTLGYSGWDAGQLESEVSENAWIVVPGEMDLIFKTPAKDKIKGASKLMGFDIEMISPDYGSA